MIITGGFNVYAREVEDVIVEQEGVRRARARAGEADLVLWLADTSGAPVEYHGTAPLWLVRNKIDLVRADATHATARVGQWPSSGFPPGMAPASPS